MGTRHPDREMMACRKLLAIYEASAFERSYTFALTLDEFWRLVTECCHYCGVEPSNVVRVPGAVFLVNGVDRVDNDRGYLPDNVVTACTPCNIAKSDGTVEEFIRRCQRVAARHAAEEDRRLAAEQDRVKAAMLDAVSREFLDYVELDR